MKAIDDRRLRETTALAELGAAELAGAVAGIHGMHRAIADRVFRSVRRGVGRAVDPVRIVHDSIVTGVYETIGTVTRTLGRAGTAGANWPGERPPSESRGGAILIGSVLGLIGDTLAAANSPLADDPMTVRVDGAIVDLRDTGTAGAIPSDRLDPREVFAGADGRIVVLVHGLCESEYIWGAGGIEADDYGVRLAADTGATPIYVRYNSGRHISDNGASLAELLERLVAVWPVPVTDLVLIGHSMGGLVARGAAHRAQLDAMTWPAVVSATISLGTPHLGAPLEQAAHYGSAALAAFPETAAFGRLLRRRSAGIRDLRGGSIVDDDWRDRDSDSLGRAVAAEVPLLPTAAHYFVAATVTRNGAHPIGRLLGDGLVLTPSASGAHRARRIGFAPDAGLHLGRAHHFTLLHSDTVYEQLRSWLDRSWRSIAPTGT